MDPSCSERLPRQEIHHFKPSHVYSDMLITSGVISGPRRRQGLSLKSDTCTLQRVKPSSKSKAGLGHAASAESERIPSEPTISENYVDKSDLKTGARPPTEPDDVPMDPPPPPPQDASLPASSGQARRYRMHPKSFHWGPHTVSFKPPCSWQATCARKKAHSKPGMPGTRCTRSLSYKGEELIRGRSLVNTN